MGKSGVTLEIRKLFHVAAIRAAGRESGMGRKSRRKRERREQGLAFDARLGLGASSGSDARSEVDGAIESLFNKQWKAVEGVFRKYRRADVAVALCASELWPANVGSPIKHIFAWVVLLGLQDDDHAALPIASYSEFERFAGDLYGAWPSFSMLEDFWPEADWGQIKIRLGQNLVPMFYGSCIERTPDFVEAFRITYAHSKEAQADMDLAVALQARIIELLPDAGTQLLVESRPAHVETPPEKFWVDCRAALIRLGAELVPLRDRVGHRLDAAFGIFKRAVSWNDFGDSVMEGAALPYLAVADGSFWMPMSVRNAPGVVIDHWARRGTSDVTGPNHFRLARFVAERYPSTMPLPSVIVINNKEHTDLPISCVVSAESGLYLICACAHASIEKLAGAAKKIFEELRRSASSHFRSNGRDFFVSKDGRVEVRADEVRIIIVPTLAGTGLAMLARPAGPAKILPLADFITIFDGLTDLDELEHYWTFVDAESSRLSPFSTGPADLYASFKETHGVLVEGAVAPTLISLDPHWGTSYRFKALSSFWALAPQYFPDDSSAWRVGRSTEGVVHLESRHHKAIAYSTCVGDCTVQTMVEISDELRIEDARVLDVFAQLFADCAFRCRGLLSDVPLFYRPTLLLKCVPDPTSLVHPNDPLPEIQSFDRTVTGSVPDTKRDGAFQLVIDTRAVLAGLSSAQDGSFEVRCMLEAMERCLAVCGRNLPAAMEARLRHLMSAPARFHMKLVSRNVDVPDYVEPIIPTPKDYKLARRHLAAGIRALGISPGRYELSDAKIKMDAASSYLRAHIEARLLSFRKSELLKACIEQHDALLVAERLKVQRARQSLSHEVEYDRLEAVETAREQFGLAARHYRYLLEKAVSTSTFGDAEVSVDVMRELVGLVDWYMVLTLASDFLHNEIGAGGVEISDDFIPEVFYAPNAAGQDRQYAREYAKVRLGLELNADDLVDGEPSTLLKSAAVAGAFVADLGFDLLSLLASLQVLAHAQRVGFAETLSLSYMADTAQIASAFVNHIDGLDLDAARKIVHFLTLSGADIRRLTGRTVDEPDVPYWEHSKRVHRYTIRPLVREGDRLRWGAETASRAMTIWMAAVRDGFLPAEFDWPHVQPEIRKIKGSIEKRLEQRTETIFLRHTIFVRRGIDFHRKFRAEGFEDVGDFDVLAYWPDRNLIVAVECKYNKPAYTVKDGRRLREQIFGDAEDDRDGQFSRILGRRRFLKKHRPRLIELLQWPAPAAVADKNLELYVARDVHFCTVHPPYPVPTTFLRVDALHSWIAGMLASEADETLAVPTAP